jgi:tripartite-type tricarboxylate transporter receptor subunit TctC
MRLDHSPLPSRRLTAVRLLARLLAPCLAALMATTATRADDYPVKPVRLIVTFTAGGAADLTGRIYAERLAELWKQQVVVENRTGGGGAIGADLVFRAPPDGYTLLLATNSHVINHVLYDNLAYDYTRDFSPIALVTGAPMVLVAHPSFPASDARSLIALLRANPGKFQYTSCNIASAHHFAMEMLKTATHVNAMNIAHRGCAPAVADTVAGHIPLAATSVPAALSFLTQGRLKAIALLSPERTPSAPDIPTMRESGLPELTGYGTDNYYGFMAPPGTPAALRSRLEADVLRVAAMPAVRAKVQSSGLDPIAVRADRMMEMIRADAVRYKAVALASGIRPE